MDSAEHEYFSSLNQMCRGIITEKVNFSSLLGSQWQSLPTEEQDALLDEHFIAPHITQRYATDDDDDIPEFFPKLKIKSGQRITEDDEGETWQDEHSGPFCWETSSQNEFSFDEDLTSTETVKQRAKDPKRPKSPRHVRTNSGDVPKPGQLERAGSSDFQQLRHIWENHHAVTPDGEMPALPSFLTKSQASLNTESQATKRVSSSVESIQEAVDEQGGTLDLPTLATNPSTVSLKSFNMDQPNSLSANVDKEVTTKVSVTTEVSKSVTKEVSKEEIAECAGTRQVTSERTERPSSLSVDNTASLATKQVNSAPLATKEDDDDITHSMNDDILKMSQIKTEIQNTMSLKNPPVANQSSAVSATANNKPEEVDILAKFGVTFGYAPEPTPSTTSTLDDNKPASDTRESDDVTTQELPSGFDFLSAW